ncbi:hypothetical protein PG999_007475 [Apiospora kogelbergensis]|uniref:Peptidase inhibitor family I36 n=1 Tax=Apiospora kogelbergensis TaxID=1337665 RepID=A0AAW0QYC4_9PEZI
MKITALSLAAFSAFLGSAAANWSLEFYETGCSSKDSSGADGYIGGSDTDELWCVAVSIAHNVVATNIAQENMEVTIFSDPLCAEGSDITTFATDGCKVIGQEASTSPDFTNGYRAD